MAMGKDKAGGYGDYYDAKEIVQRAVKRLEEKMPAHFMGHSEDPGREHVVDLGFEAPPALLGAAAKESLVDFVLRRRAELEKQQEELAFLQDVAELMRKHPNYFGEDKRS